MLTLVSIGKLAEPLFRSPPHYHDFWEICLYTSGEGVAVVGKERAPFKPGTIICYPPVIPHEEYSPRGCLEYYIATDGIAPSRGPVPVFTDSPDGAFTRLTTQLFHEYHLREPGWEQITQRLFLVLMDYLDRWRGAGHHPLVVQLKHLIMQGMADPDFNAVAAMESLPMSRDHLRRLFTRVTGETPSAYLTALRIAEAKRLLHALRLGVKETSWQVGFRDSNYFSRVFQKETGMWPTEFAAVRGHPFPAPSESDAKSPAFRPRRDLFKTTDEKDTTPKNRRRPAPG